MRLLAYALYKQAVREDAYRGVRGSPGSTRDPSPTVVRAYRESAERRIDALVTASIERATPDIQQSSVLDAVTAAEANIRNHVTARTSFVPTMFMNLAGWAVTLILTFPILVLATRADLPTFLADKVGAPGTPAHTSPPPPLRSP